MHPIIAELFAFIDAEHEALHRTLDEVPAERRDLRPSSESWTVSEVLSHLVILDRRIAGLATKLIADARARGLGAETSTESRLARFPTAKVADRSYKVVTPPASDPRAHEAPLTWSDYDAARAQLKQAFLGGDGLALGELTYPHPVLGTLDLYAWLAFIGAHAARHAAQIREIDASLVSLARAGA